MRLIIVIAHSEPETSLSAAMLLGCHPAKRDAQFPNRVRLVENDRSGNAEWIVPIGE
jgi:hypothetical protein